jgi:cobalt-zinc-cadmium efflux system protein
LQDDIVRSAAHAGAGRLRLVLLLTAAYVAVQAVGGLVTGSLALLADAGHMLIDVFGLTVALVAIQLAHRRPTMANTYGYYRLEILAALINGLLMLGIAVYVLIEAVGRFSDPPELAGLRIFAFAAPGLGINMASAFLLFEGQQNSLNLRGAYLEVLGDLAGSVAAMLAGIVTFATGSGLADPIASVGIALFILPRAGKLLLEAAHVLLEGAPREVDVSHVREHILGVSGVVGLHDLHIWNLTSGMNVVSAHVVVQKGVPTQDVLDQLDVCLGGHFDIEHTTFQIEQPDRREAERASH